MCLHFNFVKWNIRESYAFFCDFLKREECVRVNRCGGRVQSAGFAIGHTTVSQSCILSAWPLTKNGHSRSIRLYIRTAGHLRSIMYRTVTLYGAEISLGVRFSKLELREQTASVHCYHANFKKTGLENLTVYCKCRTQ